MPIITKPNLHFNPVLYFGNGGTQTVSGVGFEPGLAWIKSRGSGNNNCLVDSIRGAGNTLFSDDSASNSNLTSYFTAFTSDGYSFALGGGAFNAAYNYVAWNWKAGGAAVTNTSGSIQSQVSANPTAGFSIVTYTGTGGSGSVGHGLGAVPSVILIKARSSATNWRVYNANLGITKYLVLNSSAAEATASMWGSPTTTAFVIGGTGYEVNESGVTYVAYCFAPVAGYSAFGSYTGNGSSDGPFVFTGFRPRFVMIKQSSSSNYWWLKDSARSPTNQANLRLSPSVSDAEADDSSFNGADFLSNGFKLRGTDTTTNQSSGTYIYMAFAEAPFKYASAR
jgi:hypothetical protein